MLRSTRSDPEIGSRWLAGHRRLHDLVLAVADLDADVDQRPHVLAPALGALRILDVAEQHADLRRHQADPEVGERERVDRVGWQPRALQQPAVGDIDDHRVIVRGAVAEQHRHPGDRGGRRLEQQPEDLQPPIDDARQIDLDRRQREVVRLGLVASLQHGATQTEATVGGDGSQPGRHRQREILEDELQTRRRFGIGEARHHLLDRIAQ